MLRHAMTREQALKALELHAGASFQEIKQAYRDLALVWHPDRFAHHGARLQEKASERFKEINAAYDVLRSYDDGPSGPHEPRTKHTGAKHGASGTEQSGTETQRSRAKNRSTGPSAEHTESQNLRNRLSRLWNRWSAFARRGIERVPTPVAIAGHLVAVYILFVPPELRGVIPAIVFAVIFTFAPLIFIRWSAGAESWREAIVDLCVFSVIAVAVLVTGTVGAALLILSPGYAATGVLQWLGFENPLGEKVPLFLGALLLLLVAVTFYLYRFVVGPLARLVRRKQQR